MGWREGRYPRSMTQLATNATFVARHAERSMPRSRLVRRFGEEARIEFRPTPDGYSSASIIPTATGKPLSALFLGHLIDIARVETNTIPSTPTLRTPELLTPALTIEEAKPFLEFGFEIRSELALLIHDLNVNQTRRRPTNGTVDRLPPDSTATFLVRTARKRDREAMLRVDAAAFTEGWAMDAHDLQLAISATPSTRVRVAYTNDNSIVGFAVTGRSARRGYLQRLSVAPEYAGHGIGTQLVVDCIAWCRRHRVQRVVVNTQLENLRALALYRRLHFEDAPTRLVLLKLAARAGDRPSAADSYGS
jgi:ribosomal protein S18 acetylase RimI-like enzyme